MGINWQNTANQISNKFKPEKLYFDGYPYYSYDDFLYGVSPNETRSFKPKVLNILIIGTNYGNSADGFNFAPILEAAKNSKERLLRDYKEFVHYETWIYLDMYSALEDPDTEYAGSLEATGGALSTFCDDNADYGFVYKGNIEQANNVDKITREINEWYRKVRPK